MRVSPAILRAPALAPPPRAPGSAGPHPACARLNQAFYEIPGNPHCLAAEPKPLQHQTPVTKITHQLTWLRDETSTFLV